MCVIQWVFDVSWLIWWQTYPTVRHSHEKNNHSAKVKVEYCSVLLRREGFQWFSRQDSTRIFWPKLMMMMMMMMAFIAGSKVKMRAKKIAKKNDFHRCQYSISSFLRGLVSSASAVHDLCLRTWSIGKP